MLRPRRLLAVAACALPLLLAVPAQAQQASTDRASVSSTGAQAAGGSSNAPSVSANGRWVVFRSDATNLVAGDTNNVYDVFLRDRLTGETRRLSVGPGGVQGNASSSGLFPTISDDGRLVVFGSSATNLTGATPTSSLYAVDVATGAVRNLPGAPAPYTGSDNITLSGDGTRYAFRGTGPASDVFVGDVATGAVRRVSQTAAGVQGDVGSGRPRLSQDGRWVVFQSTATNLVAGDTNAEQDVFIVDLAGGGGPERMSVNSSGGQGNDRTWWPGVSADGCIVSFASLATNLISPAPSAGSDRVYVRDRCQGQTTIVSVDANGAPAEAVGPAVAADGCLVSYQSNVVSPPPQPNTAAAVLRDRCAGQTSRLDLATDLTPGNAGVSPFALSATGRYAVFDTLASTLVPGDTNGLTDVFLRDRATNRRPDPQLTLSADGRTVTADALASSDLDGPTLTGSIAWGDGSPDSTGLRATHAYARGGTASVVVTVTDSDGATASKAASITLPEPGGTPSGTGGGPGTTPPAGGGTGAGVTPRPTVRGLRLARKRFKVVAPGKRPSGSRGTTLALTLSQDATVRLRFDRAAQGRRKGRRCVAGRKRGRRCTRYSAAGSQSQAARAGAVAVPITGRVRGRALRPGTYRLRVDAAANGRRSAVQTLAVEVIR